MASTIKLKRGSGAPSGGSLATGELGLDLTNNVIYSSSNGSDVVQLSVTDVSDLGITATTTELNYVDGVTSNIQTQLDAKIESVDFTNITGNIEATGSLLRVFETTSFASADYHVLENGNESVGILRLAHTGSTPVGLFITYNNASPDNNNVNQYFIACQDSTTQRFYVFSDGDVVNHDNSYGGISDENLKQQITDASAQWDDIKAVTVRNYKYNTDVNQYGDSDDLWRLGVVAQELELVSPHLVKDTVDEDGNVTKSVKYSILYMKAVKALQEAMERIETLENKVAVLEAK